MRLRVARKVLRSEKERRSRFQRSVTVERARDRQRRAWALDQRLDPYGYSTGWHLSGACAFCGEQDCWRTHDSEDEWRADQWCESCDDYHEDAPC